MSSTPDLFSLLPAADGLGLPDRDTAWVFETDADPTQMHMQMQFSDFGSADIEIPDIPALQPLTTSGSRMRTDAHTDLVAGQGLPADYQASNGSSLSVPEPLSTSAPSASFLWPSPPSSSPSPRFPVAAPDAQPHMGQAQASLCRSQSSGMSAQTCVTAALRILTTLHVAHSACLSAHREAPASQQARKMETVLATNKDVVAGMGPILACPCSARSLVQLLLLSICGNLIAWNSAMISADLGQGDDPFSSSAGAGGLSAGGPSNQAPRARVLAQPITIGQHQISGKLGRALNAQIMAGELRNLEGLVDALSRRLAETSNPDGTSNTSPGTADMGNSSGRATASRDTPSSQAKGLANNVHRHIITSLHTRLENTRARIFAFD